MICEDIIDSRSLAEKIRERLVVDCEGRLVSLFDEREGRFDVAVNAIRVRNRCLFSANEYLRVHI